MSSEPAVRVCGVSKRYRQYRRPADRLIEALSFGRRPRHTVVEALRDVSFEARAGECIGILGRNGSGKSTLLAIITGTVRPSAGQVERRGRIAALLELGTAFSPEVSGRENIYHYAAALQIPRAEIERRIDEVIDYAELGAFIDYPLRTYSSGMEARLAFAVATRIDADLLIVDETLAVGDVAFRHKALRTLQKLRVRGCTVLFVTHNPSQVIGLADRALLLDAGRLVADGRPAEVVPHYQRLAPVHGRVRPGGEAPAHTDVELGLSPSAVRFGRGGATLLGVGISEDGVGPSATIRSSGTLHVRISFRADEPIDQPNVGFLVLNRDGVAVTSANLQMFGLYPEPLPAGAVRTAEFELEIPRLAPGSYSLHATVADGLGADGLYLDSVEQACVFSVDHGEEIYGLLRVPTKVRLREQAPRRAQRAEGERSQ
jgi:lipopolysaccharide transport system ATP-binding protein